MELNFKIQRNEETQLQKLFEKYHKKHNRRKIVEEMIEVRKANKEALKERKVYKSAGALMVRETALAKRPNRAAAAVSYRVKKSYFSVHSTVLYMWYSFLDGLESLKRNKGIIAAFMLFLVAAGSCTLAYNRLFGYEVVFNGYNLGVVRDMNDLNEAIRISETRFAEWYRNDSVFFEHTITTKLTYIRNANDVLTVSDIENAIVESNIPLFSEGAVVTIDGKEAAQLATVKEAQYVIDMIKYAGIDPIDPGVTTTQIITTEVEQELAYVPKTVNIANIMSTKQALKYLTDPTAKPPQTVASKTILPGQTVDMPDEPDNEFKYAGNKENAGMMTALDFRKDRFASNTPSLMDKPVLTTTTKREVLYDEPIKFEITYQKDPTIFEGTQRTISEGVNGTKQVQAIVTYVNGKESDKVILSETVTKAPINKVVGRGSKPTPAAFSTGAFIVPVTGRVSSFGTDRSGSHANYNAIDIAAPLGTKIIAADSGTVTRASYNGGYGNCIIIKHADSLSTLYGHLSAYDVVVGDVVVQGEVIGRVGSTGNSTGPHLHFEIRYKDVRQNLNNYFTNMYEGKRVSAGD